MNYTYRLSMHFQHPDRDLSDIPEQLGLTASRLFRKGDHKVGGKGQLLDWVHPDSHCSIYFGEDHQADLSEGLAAAIEYLKPHKAYLEQLFLQGVTHWFFVGWFSSECNSGDRLSWELLRDMADLRFSLDMDIYASLEDQNDLVKTSQ